MAKLTAPLFSFAASGKLADTLVFMGWKGLNNVRKYVIPSNPQTTAQNTQRGYLGDAVDMVHAAQAEAVDPLDSADQMALSALGSLEATPRTWFNTQVKMYIEQHVAALKGAIFRNITLTPGVDKVTVQGTFTKEGANDITAVNIKYGTSPTNLIGTVAATKAELAAGKDVTSLVTDVKYYFQIQPTAHADFVGMNSGIYNAVAG